VSGCGADYIALIGVGGPQADRTFEVGGARFELEIGRRNLTVSDEVVERWVRRAALMLADYCGGFPVPELDVRVVSGVPGGVLFGQHWRGRRVAVLVGGSATPGGLETDWVMVHELAHTAFPDLPRRHLWMREGMSTYLETLLRTRSGVFTEDRAWRHWARTLPRGLPRAEDGGLDRARGIGRTYIGGALFWFQVDVEVRAATNNERSLRDVVTAILDAGGNSRRRWAVARVLRVADEATGTAVVSQRYRELALAPGRPDLEALFARLGVSISGREVVYDDDAPLAHVRRAMYRRAPLELPAIEPR